MKKLASSLIFIIGLPLISLAVPQRHCVWEVRSQATSANNSGGFVWSVMASTPTYVWTISGSGTSEYKVAFATGGGLQISSPTCVTTNGTFGLATYGTLGSLTTGQWAWGDNDGLGYNTLYVRTDDSSDPDNKPFMTVAMGISGGTDYSQQLTYQFYVGGATTSGVFNVICTTRAIPQMVGNIINITGGTNFTVGRYEIQSVLVSSALVCDRPVATGVGSAGVYYIGGALNNFQDAQADLIQAGNMMHIKNDGVYTLTGSVLPAVVGLSTSVSIIEGYNSIRGDTPTGMNRPYIVAGANTMGSQNYMQFRNLIFDGTANSLVSTPYTGGGLFNCAVFCRSNTAARSAILMVNQSNVFNCEAVSNAGVGATLGSSAGGKIHSSYFHDSATGVFVTSGDHLIITNTIFNDNKAGFWSQGATSLAHQILNCVFYVSTGVADTSGVVNEAITNDALNVINSIFQNFRIGISAPFASTIPSWNLIYNLFFGNFQDFGPNIMRVAGNFYGDPKFVNPNGTLVHDCENAWLEYKGTGVTAGLDTAVYRAGISSVKATMDATTGVEVVMTSTLNVTNMSAYNGLRMWLRSNVALASGDYQLLLDDTASCVSPVVTYPVPAMSANTWYRMYLGPLSLSTSTAIISIGFKQAVDKGAMILYIDDVRASDSDFTIQSGSSATVNGNQPTTAVGIVGNYKINIGVDQDDNASSSGGGGGSFTFIH